MQLASKTFQNNAILPADYTCRGMGVNPPLTISGVPTGAQSLALIMHDPDAIGGQDFVHWTLWDIPPDTTEIIENSVPAGSTQGRNDYPQIAYGPACPPTGSGSHRYVFDLYALDTTLDLPEGADRKKLEAAIYGHTLATAQLIGIVES